MTACPDDDGLDDCTCDFVQVIHDQGERIELHHVIPDDGAPHVTDVDCPCGPDIERLETDLIVVDHLDQDAAVQGATLTNP
jgi:hypothetical protein